MHSLDVYAAVFSLILTKIVSSPPYCYLKLIEHFGPPSLPFTV